jgi:hypothetical protein
MRLLRAVSGSSEAGIQLLSGNTIELYDFSGGGYTWQLVTSQLFQDVSAWYHLLIAFDTTQGTAANRVSLYVNGTKVSTFSTSSYPSQNFDGLINTTNAHAIAGSDLFFDGYLADIHFIDGQALDPTSLGEFSATTGVWMPKAYTGTYGTNGFHLDFSNNASAAALGTDSSGQGNTWSVNNLSVAAGAGNDSLVDVPTNGSETDTGVGNEVRGNYATWNPLDAATPSSLSNGNLDQSGGNNVRATIGGIGSGKWYWEFTKTSNRDTGGTNIGHVGIFPNSTAISALSTFALLRDDGLLQENGSSISTYSTWTNGDVMGVAMNNDTSEYSIYKNGSLLFTRNYPSGITAANATPAIRNNTGQSGSANFGQRPFAYTAPSGFKALCTANLPAPVITKPNTVMDVALWTGSSTSSARTISGLQFSPDLVWAKSRSLSYSHNLYDTVRGTGKGLYSDSTGAESTNNIYGYISAFNSDGFTATPGSTDNGFFNETNATYAAWCWDAGSSTVTDNTGSIQSSRRTNASAGISIVTWTQTGSSGDTPTVGHGLGVAPSLILTKNRGGAVDWRSYHASLGVNKVIWLNSTLGAGDIGSPPGWSISSTTFGMKNGQVVDSGNSMVAYCFAPVAGYANAFSYSGNGSTDGPMVYLGFRPALIILKRTDSANDWGIFDNKRLGYNPQTAFLFPNASYSESASDYMDLLSNGFKIRRTNAEYNASGGTYIGFAWAESPFQYARAR